MVVAVPVVDLRSQPHTTAAAGVHDPLQETQLLYGERVRVHKTEEGWAFIEAAEQPEFTHARRWEGYPGWLPLASLKRPDPFQEPAIVVTEAWAPTWFDPHRLSPSPWQFAMGTYLAATDMGGQLWRIELVDGGLVWMPRPYARALSELVALSVPEKRRMILASAQRLVGTPYVWGGRSPKATWPEGDQVTGIDCSGLVNLAYRTAGIQVPRDAHEQFLRATRLNTPQPADLIFLSEQGNPARIVHVMLYAGSGELIEGPGTGLAVRRITVEKRLGRPLDQIAPGTVIDGQTVSFGGYLP